MAFYGATSGETKAALPYAMLLAMGFTGPRKAGPPEGFGVALTDRGNVARDKRWMTNVDGVFTAGDMQRSQSLIVGERRRAQRRASRR